MRRQTRQFDRVGITAALHQCRRRRRARLVNHHQPRGRSPAIQQSPLNGIGRPIPDHPTIDRGPTRRRQFPIRRQGNRDTLIGRVGIRSGRGRRHRRDLNHVTVMTRKGDREGR